MDPEWVDRYLVTTEPRPLRLAVVLDSPVSRRSYRRAIRALTGTWGGVRSVLASSGGPHLDDRWTPTLRALDPDVVFVPRRLAGLKARRELAESLDRIRVSPRWIVPFSDELSLEPGWKPQAIGAYLPDSLADTDELASVRRAIPRRLTPLLEALLGLPLVPSPAPRGRRRDTASARGLSMAIVRGSPVARSASVTPFLQSRPLILNPFVLHESDDLETGMWLWNLRALRGGFRHGGLDEFDRYLAQIPTSSRARWTVVHVGSLPPAAQKLVDDAGLATRIRFYPLDESAQVRVDFGRAPERERDEVVVTDGTVSVPARRPGLSASPVPRAPASAGTTGVEHGAFAVDVGLEPLDREGLALSFPPRKALNDSVLAMARLVRFTPSEASYPRSRVGGTGNLVVLPSPAAGSRPVPLALPVMADVLTRLDPTSTYELSDKGRYARWMTSQVGFRGLHELLVGARSRVLLDALQAQRLHFMTLDEMKRHLRDLRSSGGLPRASASPRDDHWLGEWVPRQVAAKVLRQGIAAKCHECLAESFLAFGSFTATYSCVRCGASAATPPIPRLGYQLGEVPYQFLFHHGGVSALALAAIGRRAVAGFSFDFEHIIRREQGISELDFFATVDGQLVIGEAKTNGAFDDKTFRVLRATALRLVADVVVLAADQECGDGCTDVCGNSILEAINYTRDTCLRSGHGAPGPREKVEKLRRDLAPRSVVVLCRGSLTADYRLGGNLF